MLSNTQIFKLRLYNYIKTAPTPKSGLQVCAVQSFFNLVSALQERSDCILRLKAYSVIHCFSVAEHKHCRNSHYAKLCCKLGIFVYIYFAKLHFRHFRRKLLDDRPQRSARRTPRRPKIHQDRKRTLKHLLIKILFIHCKNCH